MILIEFAFSVPVFLLLIFYSHDACRLKRLQRKMRFVSLEVVSILQNISQNRANKAITMTDLKYAMATSFLSWCPAGELFPKSGFFMGASPTCIIYYFYGTEKNTATCKWYCRSENWRAPPTNSTFQTTGIHWERSVDYRQTDTRKIHPSFTIEKGEYKVLVESFAYYKNSFCKSDGSMNVSPKDSLSFYLITPRYYCGTYDTVRSSNGFSNNLDKYGNGDNIGTGGFFNSVVIFTPRPGLFSDTPPQ